MCSDRPSQMDPRLNRTDNGKALDASGRNEKRTRQSEVRRRVRDLAPVPLELVEL